MIYTMTRYLDVLGGKTKQQMIVQKHFQNIQKSDSEDYLVYTVTTAICNKNLRLSLFIWQMILSKMTNKVDNK